MPPCRFDLPRLHVAEGLAAGLELPLGREQASRLTGVLRLREGAALLVFNGRDGEHEASLHLEGRRAALRIGERLREQTPAPALRWLFAPLKHARLDYMVQKAVELGAGSVEPVITRRTQVARVNLDRMRAGVIEAAEQCGVLALPEVVADEPLPARLARLDPGLPLVFCDEDAPPADPVAALRALPEGGPAAVLVGPEGGFDETERAMLRGRAGVVRLSLGPRILRADTAAVAALALVQAVRGDWRGDGPNDPPP